MQVGGWGMLLPRSRPRPHPQKGIMTASLWNHCKGF